MNSSEIYQLTYSIIGSVGCASVIILGLSSWLGKVWANRILEEEKSNYAKDLEIIKAQVQRESDKQRITFSMYFEGQFKFYNELWMSLADLNEKTEKLWDDASKENLKHFVKSIKTAKKQLESKAIMIEREHYLKLHEILTAFENYQIGKEKLIQSRRFDYVDFYDIERLIKDNGEHKEIINKLLYSILEAMQNQISGKVQIRTNN